MANADVALTLDEAVAEVLGILTGLDLRYAPEQDRYATITRTLNRALRANALEREWSYYSSTEEVGVARAGEQTVALRSSVRPRIINDDAVRLTHDGVPVSWVYFLPRDALSKHHNRAKLWCAVTRNTLEFSRPFSQAEHGLTIEVPVMREPRMFRLPEQPEDPDEPLTTVPASIRNQLLDFDFPDVVVMRAAYFYAQTDPVMQPRVQTLEAQYKDLMYQLIARDEANTDAPFQNEFFVPITSGLHEPATGYHGHPHSDERRGG